MENKFVREKGMNIPVLTNEKDKAPSLDVIRYKIKEEAFFNYGEKQQKILLDDPQVSQSFYEIITDSIHRQFNIKGNRVTDIFEWIKQPANYKRDRIAQYYKYKTRREYYENGQLKKYTVSLDGLNANNVKLGTWYRFDESGDLLHTIDNERYFKTHYLDVYKIAVSYNRVHFRISRYFNAEKSYWSIRLIPIDYEPNPWVYIIIDDDTGEIIDELTIDESYKGDEESIRAWLNRYYDEDFQKKTYRPFFD